MKTYQIANSSTEVIVFRVADSKEEKYALVHRLKATATGGNIFKTIILNKREVLKLYQAIQDEMLIPFEK